MKLRLYIIFIGIFFSNFCNGQKNNLLNFDTAVCEERSGLLNLKDKHVLKGLADAANYIQTIVGTQIFENNIRLDYCMSRESGFQVYGNSIKKPTRLREDTCYELQYYVTDKHEILGYFQLSIDRLGKLVTYDGEDFTSRPELLRGFKKCIEREFKIDFAKAIDIGRKRGLITNPVLNSRTENVFLQSQKKTFVKAAYYWVFSEPITGGGWATLEINAETGQIERERFVPPMPK
jgi:hypothetical protein